MTKYKIRFNFWFMCAISFLIVFGLLRTIYMIETGGLTWADGPIEGFEKTFIITLFSVVCVLYLPTIFSILKIIFLYKCKPFEITPEGVKNTFVFTVFLCFVIIRPVDFIPWESVKNVITAGDLVINLRLKTKDIKASPIAKLVLKLLGYSFCITFVKPELTEVDIDYCVRHCEQHSKINKIL